MQVGHHARGSLVGDLDRCLQYTLGDDVGLGRARGLGADEEAVVLVALLGVLVYLLLQDREPLGHKMDIL